MSQSLKNCCGGDSGDLTQKIVDAVESLTANAGKVNTFTNGTETETVNLGGVGTKTVRGMVKDFTDSMTGYLHLSEEFAARAEAAATETYLESGVYNIRRSFVVAEDTAAGEILTLPAPYYPTRNVLWLSYQDVPCTPKIADAAATGRYQYEEVGEDPNVLSNEIKLSFDVRAGAKFELWIVTSALGTNLDAQAAYTAACQAAVQDAQEAAATAANDAVNAAEGLLQGYVSDAQGFAAAASSSAANAASSASAASVSAENAQEAASTAEAIKNEIQSIQGVVTYLDGHDFGDPAEDPDWQQTLTDYALAQVPDWESVPNSCDVVNLWDGHEHIYNIETQQWIDWGPATVSHATNETSGTVRGNANTPGKISVGTNGEMTVNTIPAQNTILTEALPANSVFTVPAYQVGSGMLKIFLYGLLCPAGTTVENGFYSEVDSTTIRIFDSLPVGATITAVLTA